MASILDQAHKIHFIGIGGIGISAIARMFLLQGKRVSGSDLSDSEIIHELGKAGATITIGHRADNVPSDTDLVIYTIAIQNTNPELVRAKEVTKNVLSYPEALHEISAEKYTIAVSGTHGKTTTTAMIAKVLIDAGLDPTVIVGSLLKDSGTPSNFIAGDSQYFVVEACEYRRSFLNLQPTILIINNIDNDHLDYYKDLADIESAFRELALRVPADGYIIADTEDEAIKRILSGATAKVINRQSYQEKIALKVPGAHNQTNAAAVLALATVLRLTKEQTLKSLSDFSGTWRRFEHKGTLPDGTLIYDDYGHHPTEVKATLSGAREMWPDKKIIVVFQPHLFSRTKDHLEEFAHAFTDADEVVLAPIYAAREAFDSTISSAMLAERIGDGAMALNSFTEIGDYLKTKSNSQTVVMTMGAGDVYQVGEALLAA